jgi:hypothetical protein
MKRTYASEYRRREQERPVACSQARDGRARTNTAESPAGIVEPTMSAVGATGAVPNGLKQATMAGAGCR